MRLTLVLFAMALLAAGTAQAQEQPVITEVVFEEDEDVEKEVYTIVEVMPEFPGGRDSLWAFMVKQLEYPSEAKEQKIEGKVYVRFIVDEKGELSDFEVIRGIGGGCNEAAIKVLEAMPLWTPGKHRGKPVKIRMVLPFEFALSPKE